MTDRRGLADARTINLRRKFSLSRTSWSLGGRARPALLLAVGLVATALAFLAVRRREIQAARMEFESDARQLSRPIRKGLRLPLELLYLLPSFFDSSDDVTREEFRTFVQRALERHPALFVVHWIPLVKAEERERYERSAHADGLSDFEFRDLDPDRGTYFRAPRRSEYLPVFYMVPQMPALGLDFSAGPRREDLERARRQKGAVVSNRFEAFSRPEGDYLVAAYHPVFLGASDEEEQRLGGFVGIVFRVRALMEETFSRSLDEMHVVLVDDSAPPDLQLVFTSSSEAVGEIERSVSSWRIDIPVADRSWELRMAPIPAPTGGLFSWLVLGVGTGVSVFLAVGVVSASTISKLRRQVEEAVKLGQYTLEAKIGEGGMGEVWKARHALLRRPTAVKLVRKELIGEKALQRFEREVHATSSLTHPNTVAIYDYGHTDEGTFYYAMEFLPGLTLAQLVKRFGPQPPSRVIHFLVQVCGALNEAHERGIIHRDIKPQNLILCERGGVHDVVKVVDFGLAKFWKRSDATITGHNVVVGTPHFLAPEALSSETVGPRSDLYSLGAVGYYLLTGSTPFSGDNVLEISLKVLNEKLQRPSERLGREIREDLERVILSCLDGKPERRHESAAAVGRALESCRDAGKWTQEEAEHWFRQAKLSSKGADLV